jgi:Ni,Fe-hydrogenase III large subunit
MTTVEPQAAAGTREQLVRQLVAIGGTEAQDGNATRGAVTICIPAESLEEATHAVAGTSGVRLADMFAADGDTTILRLVWAHESGYIITESQIEGSHYPPLSDIAPAAFVEECEIYEQFGIRPASGKPLNRIMLPPHVGQDFPRLGHQPPEPPEEVHAPHIVGGQAFEFPFGPVRQVGVESLYYGLVTSGEEVVDLYLFTWHKHRGVEWRLRGKTAREASFLAERAEGLSAVAVGWAFAAATEAAVGIAPPSAAARTRAVALELERLYNHAAATAALCQATGLSVGQSAAEIALERLLRVNAAAFGHRYMFGVIEPGGVSRAPDADVLRRELPDAYGELRRAADALLKTNSFVDRLEACGILTAEQARRLGLVGPVARATGLAVDARLDTRDPRGGYVESSPYAGHPVKIVTADSGDVFARFRVMLGEADESVRLITEFLDAGTSADRTPIPPGGGAGLGWAESSRGETLAWVALDEDGRITRARLRPGSARNWRGFDDACRSQNVFTDIPIIEASFWLTVAGMARLRRWRYAVVVRPGTAPRRGHHPLPGQARQLSGIPADAARVPPAAADPRDRRSHHRGVPKQRAEPPRRPADLRRRGLHRLRQMR